jgi:hypothetical protein
MFCQSLDLTSGRRESVLVRAEQVLVTPIIGRLVADDDVLGRSGGAFLVGRFHGSNRMPTKLNYKDVAATQGLTRNLRWQPI